MQTAHYPPGCLLTYVPFRYIMPVMPKQVHFEIDDNEARILAALIKKLHKTAAAIFREGLRLLHKKETSK